MINYEDTWNSKEKFYSNKILFLFLLPQFNNFLFSLLPSFDCVLDETDLPCGECMTFKMYYYLEDDTVAIKELKENREGRDHFPMLLRKTKLPKNWQRRPG